MRRTDLMRQIKAARVLAGLAGNVLEGVLFAVIGVVMSRVALNNFSTVSYYFVGSLGALTAYCLTFVNWSAIPAAPMLWQLTALMLLAALLNNTGHLLMLANMKRGHKAASWAIGQSSMAIPFVMAGALFGEWCGFWGWMGIAAVVGGIALLATARRGVHQEKIDSVWLLMALANFACYGLGQTCTSTPSHWAGFTDLANLRVAEQMLFNTAFYLIIILFVQKRFDRRTLPLGSIYAVFSYLSYLLIFWLLDRMTGLGCSRVVWPIAVGTCIVGFSLYSRLRIREPFSRRDLAGIAGITAGLVLLALG